MEPSNKILDKFDFVVFAAITLLTAIGMAAVYSATYTHPTAYGNFNKQLISGIIAFILFFVAYLIPYKTYRFIAAPVYVISLLSLLAVIFIGKTVYGSKSWVSFGPIGFQPSEFAKIGLILFLAYYLTRKRKNPNNFYDLFIISVITLIPVALILMQPDMGTAIVYVIISLIMVFWSGVDLFLFFLLISPVVVVFASLFGLATFLICMILVIALLVYFKKNVFVNASIIVLNISAAYLMDYGINFLKPHQQKRIETFINPLADPLGAGYNIMQTKVAIGSGGIWGKGFLHGNQTQLRFIPEQWTDFIFCVIGEEFGFVGSILTIALFIVLFFKLVNIATHTKNIFGSTVVVGILALMFTHFAINIGMNIGVAPVIGLPLPFLSFGGSSLIVNMILIGIALNFYKNRREQI
ncbi:MAG: rod shape-determining protein RodA [Ignavibacteriae bacterium]|nr:rod shape-determining protein RodA [Ignavibacteriota bacterium]